MTYNKDFGFMCDNCQEEEGEGESFYEDKELIDLHGWKTTKDTSGNWVHYCSDCSEKFSQIDIAGQSKYMSGYDESETPNHILKDL